VAAVAIAGCGPVASRDSSSAFKGEQRLVANAIEDLQSAGQHHDAAQICSDLLAADLVRKIRQAGRVSGGTCAQRLKKSLEDADDFELTVRRVTISGRTARAVVVAGASGATDRRTETFRLVKEGTPTRWRIADMGAQ
jgi:hypothetical protein